MWKNRLLPDPLVIFPYFYLLLVKFYRLRNLSKIRKYLTKESCEIAVHVAHVGLFDPERSILAYVAKLYIAGITYCLISFITTSRRFKCVPQILGLSSIHIFRLLFLPLSITFRRIHERNSFDLGAICLFCFEFCCLIDFLIPIVTWWVLNLSIKTLGLAC